MKHHSLPVTLFSTYEIRFVWTWICHIDWKCLFRGCRIISEQPPFQCDTEDNKKQKTGIFSDFQQTSFTKTQSHVECTRFMTVSFDSEKAQALILLIALWRLSGFRPEAFPSPRPCFPKAHRWHQQPAFVNPSSAAGQAGKSKKRLLFCSLAGRPGPAAPSNPEEGNMKKKRAANQILYLLL